MTDNKTDVTVHLGDGVVTVRRKGSSAVIVASVLGEIVNGEVKEMYLDRLVHKPGESQLGHYPVAGATTSILTVPAA